MWRCSAPVKPLLLALWLGASAFGAQTSPAPESSPYLSEVITLKYALASEVAPVLSRMLTDRAAPITAEVSPGLQRLIQKAAGSGHIQTSGQSPVIVDERTNSLLLYARREQLQKFKQMISRLDVQGTQILLEGAVFQLPPADAKTLNRSNLLSVTPFFPRAPLNGGSNQLSRFEYLAQLGNSLEAMVAALPSDSRVTLLQRPRLQTSDGVKTALFLGESRPGPISGGYFGAGAYGSYASLQDLKVGVTLELTPFVTRDGSIILDIHQILVQRSGNTNLAKGGDMPMTTSSEGRASVVVRDRGTILLGGLVATVKNHTRHSVLLLKELPLLYGLFDRVTTRTERKEIIILLRATILPAVTQT